MEWRRLRSLQSEGGLGYERARFPCLESCPCGLQRWCDRPDQWLRAVPEVEGAELMRRVIGAARGLTLAILFAGCLVLAAAGEVAARIPSFQGTTFAGQTVSLPQQLKGGEGVLVLGFSKSSGDVCKGWGQRVAESYRDSHDVTYFQMPVLESVPKLIRGMVMRSIKSGVPEAEQPHFLPVFSNEAEWRTIARYANPDDAYILVVDGEGIVRWQTSGKVTDAGFAALKRQVETVRTQLRESTPNRAAHRGLEAVRLRNILLALCVCICSGV